MMAISHKSGVVRKKADSILRSQPFFFAVLLAALLHRAALLFPKPPNINSKNERESLSRLLLIKRAALKLESSLSSFVS